MDVINFYWSNILAACFLVFSLGLIGQHLVARNQSMEIMLLGHEFQTGILLAAIIMNLMTGDEHSDHGIHFESFLSFIFVFLYHGLYLAIVKRHRVFRIEGAIIGIILLIGLNHLIVLLSPVVEFHMIKSAIGDIVTVSRVEAIGVSIISFLIILYFLKKQHLFLQDTIEISLFNRLTGKRASSLIFNFLLYLLMLLSIHLFGTLFTLGCMLIPSFVTSISKIPRQNYIYFLMMNCVMVLIGFSIMMVWDRLPTTVVIIFLIGLSTILMQFLFKKSA